MLPIRLSRYVGALAVIVAGALSGQEPSGDLAVEADSVTFDAQNGSSVFKQLSVSDGTLSIRANEGSATDGEGDERTWQFTGAVEIQFATAMIIAERATFRSATGQLTGGEVIGHPVAFEAMQTESRTAFRGAAGRISYDRSTGVVAAGDGASFAYDNMRVQNCNWTYSLSDGAYEAVANDNNKCVVSIARSDSNVPK